MKTSKWFCVYVLAWSLIALAGCGPPPPPECVETHGGVEQCDSIDNDCDGSVDEGLMCSGADAGGCTETNGGTEQCDGFTESARASGLETPC